MTTEQTFSRTNMSVATRFLNLYKDGRFSKFSEGQTFLNVDSTIFSPRLSVLYCRQDASFV